MSYRIHVMEKLKENIRSHLQISQPQMSQRKASLHPRLKVAAIEKVSTVQNTVKVHILIICLAMNLKHRLRMETQWTEIKGRNLKYLEQQCGFAVMFMTPALESQVHYQYA